MDTQLLVQLATTTGSPVAAMLAGAPVREDDTDVTMPAWLDTDLVHARMDVWSAVGVVMVASSLQSADALALLRAHAYGQGASLDDVAARLTTGALDVDEVVQAASLG